MCMTWSDHKSYLLLLSLPALHVPFVFLLSTWSLLSCMIVQVARRKESIPSGALPSQNVRLLGPPVRHRRNSSVVYYEVWLALLGMQHGRMVMQNHLSHSALLLFVTLALFSTWCLSTGKGAMCAINRSSIFFLLSIQIHLCDLVRCLYVDITARNQRKSQGLIWKVLSVGIPCLLMGVSYGGLFEFIHVCHGSLMVSSFLMTNACHQLNVTRTVEQARTISSMWRDMHFRAQWGLVPFDPVVVLACAVCRRRRTKCLDVSVLSDDVRFSNMGTEWGGYHFAKPLLFESLLDPLSVLLWCLFTMLMGGAQFASVSAKKD